MILKIERWKLWLFMGLVLYYMIAMFGHGLETAQADFRRFEASYDRIDKAKSHLIDLLLIESGRDPMYNTRQEVRFQWKQYTTDELFNTENQNNG